MKKKNIKLKMLLSIFLTTFISQSKAQEEFVINVADITPPAAPAPAAPPMSPPPAAAAAPADTPHPEPELDCNKPLLPKSQYFNYACLSSASVTLNTLQQMDCAHFKRIYAECPQRAVDHLSLLLLTNRALQGADVANMPEQDRIDLAYATILGEIRKYGRECEARGYMGLGEGECKDRLIIPSAAALCQVLEGVKAAIILELYHVKLIFPVG